jgi:hypothetical protein
MKEGTVAPRLALPRDPSVCPGFGRAACLSRRGVLRVGGLGVFGLGLGDLLSARAGDDASPPRRRQSLGGAKACIVLFMWGGPSQLDTWDPKPEAPAEVRGEFRAIATRVPGVRVSEHFPRLARLADRYAIIRSLTHDDPAHLSSVHHLLTGRHAPKVKSDAASPSRRDSPAVGSVLARLRPTGLALPPFVTMPWIVSHPAAPGGKAPGQNAGWLGPAYDPFVLTADPAATEFAVPQLARPDDLTAERLEARRGLLARLGAGATGREGFSDSLNRALDLLTSDAARRAFDLSREPAPLRDRYGRHTHGQCLLLARRLIEAGVRLVCVNWHQDGQNFWDTHENNFSSLKHRLMPPADQGFSALLEDLSQRGLLDETLVVWVGEFGRSPRVSQGNAGREHHPGCYSAVLAGGGVQGGQVYGRSDRLAAYPAADPVSPADLTATVYHALGIPPGATLQDREGRPSALTEGRPLSALFSALLVGEALAIPPAPEAENVGPTIPAGKWVVTFSNGVVETCEVAQDGMVSVSEPRRSSRGKAEAKDDAVVVPFEDDRVERWTPVGNRFVVEHWFPASAYPAGARVLGITKRSP